MIQKNEKVLAITPYYKVAAIIEALERAGTNIKGFSLLRSEPDLVYKVARLINNEILGSTELDNQLLSLLDDSRFFGPADWLKYYDIEVIGLKLPKPVEELKAILESPCPFVEGKKVKETHYLFCMPFDYTEKPLTVNQWLEIYKHEASINFRGVDDRGHNCGYYDSDYRKLDFSKTTTANYVWYLMFEGVIPDSKNKSFFEQVHFLKNQKYELPRAIEILSMLLLVFEKNKYLIGGSSLISGRTTDPYLVYTQVTIGTMNLNGREIFIYDGPNRNDLPIKTSDITNPNVGVFGYKKLYI